MDLDENVVSGYVQVGRIRTHYVQAGHGETVVLVHGAGPGASGASGWRQTIPGLAKHYNVIAIDVLGFGYTDKPTDIVYSDQASVDHLGGFLDALCLDRVHLMGNSRGAYIAARYTLDQPQRVQSLLMVSSGSIAAAMGIERNEQQSAGRNRLAGYDGTPAAMRAWMEVIVNDHGKITDKLIEQRMAVANLPGASYAQKSQREYRRALADNSNERQRFDIRHRLPQLTIPQFMIWGAKDNFAPPIFADELKKLLPNVKFRMLENSGHQAQNDESDLFNELAIEFLGSSSNDKAAGDQSRVGGQRGAADMSVTADMSVAAASAAKRLLDAYQSRTACEPVRDLIGERDVEAAYAAQEINTRHWLRAGRRMVGRKIGLTSKAVQTQLGVDQPDFGILFDDMVAKDGGSVSCAEVMQPKIEAEVALILKAPLEKASHSVEDVVAATDCAVAALEVVGSRIRGWDIRLADTIADNASSSHFVLGSIKAPLKGLDLVGCKMEMRRGQEVVSTGSGAACMGSPLIAAVWLADTMVKFNRPLQAGDIILCGALGPMVPVVVGDTFEASIEGLGHVTVSFTA